MKHPENEGAILKTLARNKQQNYLELRHNMHKIAEERPDINTTVYTDYLREYLNASKNDQTILENTTAKFAADGKQWDPRQARAESAKRAKEFNDGFNAKITSKYGPNGKQAMEELGKRMQGPNIIGGAISQVYDKNKGGLRLGGILGLAAGWFLGSQMLGGFGGGMFGIIGTLGAMFLGAWLFNKGGDAISGAIQSSRQQDTEQGLGLSPEVAPQQQQTQGITEDVKRKAFDENLKRLGVSEAADGTFVPAQTTPAQSQPKGGKSQGPR